MREGGRWSSSRSDYKQFPGSAAAGRAGPWPWTAPQLPASSKRRADQPSAQPAAPSPGAFLGSGEGPSSCSSPLAPPHGGTLWPPPPLQSSSSASLLTSWALSDQLCVFPTGSCRARHIPRAGLSCSPGHAQPHCLVLACSLPTSDFGGPVAQQTRPLHLGRELLCFLLAPLNLPSRQMGLPKGVGERMCPLKLASRALIPCAAHNLPPTLSHPLPCALRLWMH